jgi:hypothetical protein
MPTDEAREQRGIAMIPLALGAMCVIAGLITAYFGWNHLVRAGEAHDYPSTDAVVTQSATREVDYRDPDDGMWKKRTELDFAYDYAVDGRAFTGSRLDVSGMGGPSLGDVVQSYPVGTQVPVYYDPANPGIAGLTADEGLGRFLPLGIGIGMFGLGLPFLWLAAKMWRAAGAPPGA